MVFSSLEFVCVFLPVTFLLYYLIPSVSVQNALLIIASLLFYAYGEPVYILLLLLSTVFNYAMGRLVGAKPKKGLVAAAVVINLAFLGVFKYAGMFVETANGLFGLSLRIPDIRLPIGISFYTFQALSYVIDVYRGKAEAQKNYFHILLYISFFPQLIAGPIVKYHDISRQITHRKKDLSMMAEGLRRFILGLAKKVLISNVMATAADAIFALKLGQVNIITAWIGAASYMMQIYFDFSGYSDMAIGMGRMFGFSFLENFQYPYTAVSVQDFWRKWHISLSTWFKEYLYIPLGGNRKGKARTCVNKLVVFFCTGLWHGANWTFVIWGLFHGAFLLLEEVVPVRKLPKLLGHIYTLLVVSVGFVMFRADNVLYGLGMIGKLFAGFQFDAASMNIAVRQCPPLFLFVFLLAVAGSVPWIRRVRSESRAATAAGYAVSFGLLILCMLSLSGGSYNPFIYFRF